MHSSLHISLYSTVRFTTAHINQEVSFCAALKSMSMKAGTYIRDASVKTGDAINEGTKSLRESNFAATTSQTFSTIGTRAAEGGSYLYNMGGGVIGRFAAGSALTTECAKEAKCANTHFPSPVPATSPCLHLFEAEASLMIPHYVASVPALSS